MELSNPKEYYICLPVNTFFHLKTHNKQNKLWEKEFILQDGGHIYTTPGIFLKSIYFSPFIKKNQKKAFPIIPTSMLKYPWHTTSL